MREIILAVIVLSIACCSCVTKSEHEKIISQRDAIAIQRDNYKKELEDIKFSAPNLLSDGKKFFTAKLYQQARAKFQILLEKHPDLPQTIEAVNLLAKIEEEQLWDSARTSNDIIYTDNYIAKFPKGKYLGYAVSRRNTLKAEYLQTAYTNASNQNTSFAWKRFLEEYPNYEDEADLRRKIIRLEVDEIMGQQETGKMPTFNQYQSTGASSSAVTIKNNTGCALTVRYSGPDAEIITIPSDESKTVYLSSGSYKITASACGANYAGTEALYGEYGSTFYITRSRY